MIAGGVFDVIQKALAKPICESTLKLSGSMEKERALAVLIELEGAGFISLKREAKDF